MWRWLRRVWTWLRRRFYRGPRLTVYGIQHVRLGVRQPDGSTRWVPLALRGAFEVDPNLVALTFTPDPPPEVR